MKIELCFVAETNLFLICATDRTRRMLLRLEGDPGSRIRRRRGHRDRDERGQRRVLHLDGGRHDQEESRNSGGISFRKERVSRKNRFFHGLLWQNIRSLWAIFGIVYLVFGKRLDLLWQFLHYWVNLN